MELYNLRADVGERRELLGEFAVVAVVAVGAAVGNVSASSSKGDSKGLPSCGNFAGGPLAAVDDMAAYRGTQQLVAKVARALRSQLHR